MKIFMTVLMASIAWSTADVSHLSGYNYQIQPSTFTHEKQQYSTVAFQPSPQYLPAIQQQPQSYQQQYFQPMVPQYEQQSQQPQLNYQQQYSSQLVQPLSPQYSSQQLTQPLSQQYSSQFVQPLSQPQQPQQQEYNQQQIIPSPLPQPQQQQFSHKSSSSYVLPMPSGLTVITPPQFKTGRRSRPRVRIASIKKPIVSKSFFIHSAPEESDDDVQEELRQMSQQPRKHFNVLFVRTPTQTNKAAALSLVKSLNEERTVVYVLSKKTSAADLHEALTDHPQILNKPEVFFIKYRTPEEAANAQRQIQSQYDSLGGSTSISDEGVAPVTSVVGSLDGDEDAGDEIEDEPKHQQLAQEQIHQQQSQEQHQEQQQLDQSQYNQLSGNNQYLPPNQIKAS